MGKSLGVSVGDVFENSCGAYSVINTFGTYSEVEFCTGYRKIALNYDIVRGHIKDYLAPSVHGVGFLGVGNFKPSKTLEGKTEYSREYKYWNAMICRCYDPKQNNRFATYRDVTVCKEWHNFQTFAEWCQTQTGFFTPDFALDKDLLVKGNKEYGPSTACFLPRKINCMLISTEKDREFYFRGGVFEVAYGKKHLGRVKNIDAAREMHYNYFLEELKTVAESFKGLLDTHVFNRLINYGAL